VANMSDPADRRRSLEQLDDELNRLENAYTPQPLGAEIEPIWAAWTALREEVREQLENARAAAAAAA
jgi:hypothetical protein